MGGLQSSCGEENLLSLEHDQRYPNREIVVHEFAHTLMDHGLPASAREDIERVFELAVVERGLWRRPDGSKAYAATNAQEYWAELSMWYWGSHGEFCDGKRRLPVPGPAGLARYDALGFALVGAIYDGTHAALHDDATTPPPRELSPCGADAKSAVVVHPLGEGGGEGDTLSGASTARDPSHACTLEVRGGASELAISWVDNEGVAHQYTTLPPGGIIVQHSFAGHVWQLSAAQASTCEREKLPSRRYRLENYPEQIIIADDIDSISG